jgi:putative phage-type endonuclease
MNATAQLLELPSCSIEYFTREAWLKARTGIGGSDASAILGMNPYKSNIEVWQEKTGRTTPEDIGHKSYVRYGIEAEQYLVSLFALDYPQYDVKANTTFKVYYHPQHSFIAGTLDGELTETETGRKGILETKTTEILNSMHREKWNEKIPDNYFCQVLHYLLATGWDFVVLKAQLKTVYGDEVRLNTRHYHIERADVQNDLDYLLEKEIEFWQYVVRDKKPPLVLPPI